MSTWATFKLEDVVKISVLSGAFSMLTAMAISKHLGDFLSHKNEFSSHFARMASNGNDSILEVVWNIKINNPDPSRTLLIIAVVYRDGFPQRDTEVWLRASDPSQMYIKRPYSVVGGDGRIQLQSFASFSQTRRPYDILSILMALKAQFERDYPFVHVADQGAPNPYSYHPMTGPSQPPPTASFQNASNRELIKDAAEKVIIDINQRANKYLETRRRSLEYLKKLHMQNDEIEKAKAALMKHKQKLSEYLPSAGNVNALLQQLKGHDDTIEEHAGCLVLADSLQERALELIVDNLALDDMLSLLDDGLKSEKFSCDEYVKLITDLSREQFLARFAYQKIQPQLAKLQSTSATSKTSSLSNTLRASHESAPAIPKKLAPEEMLKLEFPDADLGIIRDVLHNLNNDFSSAYKELKVMFP